MTYISKLELLTYGSFGPPDVTNIYLVDTQNKILILLTPISLIYQQLVFSLSVSIVFHKFYLFILRKKGVEKFLN